MLQDIRAAGFRVFLVPWPRRSAPWLSPRWWALSPYGRQGLRRRSRRFGWYSLAPTLLAPTPLSVSATAFLSNIMHELLSIVAVPAVAQRFGYIEAVALPGATAMDTVLPVVVSATSDRMALYSFTSGAVLSLSVPFLVPAIIAPPLLKKRQRLNLRILQTQALSFFYRRPAA